MALSTTFTQYTFEITEFGKNNAKMAILPFKVTNFGTNQSRFKTNLHRLYLEY